MCRIPLSASAPEGNATKTVPKERAASTPVETAEASPKETEAVKMQSSPLHAGVQRLSRILVVIPGVLMVALTLVIFLNVLIKNFLDIPLTFTYELAQLLFPWIVFPAIINVTLDDENIDIQFLVEMFPNWLQSVVQVFAKLVMLGFSAYITVAGISIAQAVAGSSMPILGISKAWLYWSVGVSFIGVSLVIIYQIYLTLTDRIEPGFKLETDEQEGPAK